MSSGSSTKAVEAEGALPVPEDFPVVWEEPADAQRTWRLDRLHHPDPIAPIDFWFFREIVCRGIISAAPVYDRPMEFVPRRINAYMYVSAVPQPVPDGSDGTSKLTAAALRVRELWEDELLPEVEEHLRWWSSCDLASLSLDELLSHLDETIERAERVWHLHFVVTSPAFTPVVELAGSLRGGLRCLRPRCLPPGPGLREQDRRDGTRAVEAQSSGRRVAGRRAGARSGLARRRRGSARGDRRWARLALRSPRLPRRLRAALGHLRDRRTFVDRGPVHASRHHPPLRVEVRGSVRASRAARRRARSRRRSSAGSLRACSRGGARALRAAPPGGPGGEHHHRGPRLLHRLRFDLPG